MGASAPILFVYEKDGLKMLVALTVILTQSDDVGEVINSDTVDLVMERIGLSDRIVALVNEDDSSPILIAEFDDQQEFNVMFNDLYVELNKQQVPIFVLNSVYLDSETEEQIRDMIELVDMPYITDDNILAACRGWAPYIN